MGLIYIEPKDTGVPTIEAIIQTALPESLLKVGKLYVTGVTYSKTLVYKGKEYTPGTLKLITVKADELAIIPLAANYTFAVGGKTFKVNADRSRINIIAGGEPILWRLIKAIQSNDPVDTSTTFLPTDQGIITNGTAPTKFSYFYKVNDIYQSEPLQDGVIFRYIEPGSGSITWRKFAIAGDGGIFEEFAGIPEAAIASVKNIDFTKLDDLDAIVEALDTVDGKPFDAAIQGRNLEHYINLNILVNGQTDKRQNGLYYFYCVEGKPDLSKAVRISPYLRFQIAYIGRARCLVWAGDRYGQNEAWITSDAPIGATSSAPRVSIDTTPQYWVASKPELKLERQLLDSLDRLSELEVAVHDAGLTPLLGQTVYTEATTITAKVSDSIVIDKEGDIQLMAAPDDGAEVQIFDPFGKIKAGKNNVLLGTGDRWLVHDGTFDTTAMTFGDNELRHGLMRLKYSEPTQSWWPYVFYGTHQPAAVPPSSGSKLTILTGDDELTAKPFDLISLNGTGNIRIGTFVELEYFEVQWAGAYDVLVLRPVGFTINGVNDDLRLDTADMGVRRIRFTLVGNNFEVS